MQISLIQTKISFEYIANMSKYMKLFLSLEMIAMLY